MLPQALAGISLSLFSSRYKCFRRPSQVSLFLFSLFSLPVQKATLGRAGPALKRYKCFRSPSQVSLCLFSLFSLPVQKATLGRAGPAFKRYKCFRRPSQVSLFLFSLFSLPVQKATLGRAGPALKRYKCFRSRSQKRFPGISLSLFSFLFTGSKSNVRHGRSRPQTLQMLPQAKDRERHKACETETETEKRKRPRQRLRQRQPPGATRRAEVTSACASLFFVSFLFWHVPFRFLAWLPSGCVMLDVNLAERTG